MVAQEFHKDQKVFAKIRGYPPWPAKVIEETGTRKYKVFFYGTNETAVCKMEELYDYVGFRHKFGVGKVMKRKNFDVAIREIEDALELNSRRGVTNDDSQRQSNSIATASASASPTIAENVKETNTSAVNEDDVVSCSTSTPYTKPAKALKRKQSEPEAVSPLEQISRSGRKIKPKTFHDPSTELNPTISLMARKKKSDNDKGVTNETNSVNSSSVLPSDTVENTMFLSHHQSESSSSDENVNTNVINHVSGNDHSSTTESFDNYDKLNYIKTEVVVLDSNYRIKSSLSLNGANCDACLKAIDDILDQPLTALMLVKNPELVDTAKKLRNYVGNIEQWNMTDDQRDRFNQDAAKIRWKAQMLLDKFESLFSVPPDKTFFDVFAAAVDSFFENTKHLSVTEHLKLTTEPTI